MSDEKRKFDLGDYVDVATRLVEFREKHPEGCLRPVDPAKPYWIEKIGQDAFIVYAAAAYRSPTDNLPGIGTAWEPVPGRTAYTRNSEIQNAETSAWGRAIMASLAADARKGIASAEEVRNRAAEPASPPASTSGRPATGNGASGPRRPQAGASADPAPIPPCDLCGGPGQANPQHAKNPQAPEFRCAGRCTDPATSEGREPWPHGISRATEAQINAASAALSAIAADLKARGIAHEDVDTRIRDWLESISVPRSRTAWSRAHASKAIEALKGSEFLIEDLAAGRGDAAEPPEEDDPTRQVRGF